MNCLHCYAAPQVRDGLCEKCVAYPRCRGCEVIFGEGLSQPSEEDVNYCSSCIGFEDYIEFYCKGCFKPIALFFSPKTNVLRYVVRGNWCSHCNSKTAIESRRRRIKDEEGQFSGYLAIMKAALGRGSITEEDFAEARILNPHDDKEPTIISTETSID